MTGNLSWWVADTGWDGLPCFLSWIVNPFCSRDGCGGLEKPVVPVDIVYRGIRASEVKVTGE